MFCKLIQMVHGLWPYRNITSQTQICKGAVYQQHPWVLIKPCASAEIRICACSQIWSHMLKFFLFCSVFPQRAQFFPSLLLSHFHWHKWLIVCSDLSFQFQSLSSWDVTEMQRLSTLPEQRGTRDTWKLSTISIGIFFSQWRTLHVKASCSAAWIQPTWSSLFTS